MNVFVDGKGLLWFVHGLSFVCLFRLSMFWASFVQESGILFGPLFLIVVSCVAILSIYFLLETLSRANALIWYERFRGPTKNAAVTRIVELERVSGILHGAHGGDSRRLFSLSDKNEASMDRIFDGEEFPSSRSKDSRSSLQSSVQSLDSNLDFYSSDKGLESSEEKETFLSHEQTSDVSHAFDLVKRFLFPFPLFLSPLPSFFFF